MITLYTTHCPKCKILQQKLDQKKVDYEIIDDEETVLEFGKDIGILSTPILEVNGVAFDFNGAIKWLASKETV